MQDPRFVERCLPTEEEDEDPRFHKLIPEEF